MADGAQLVRCGAQLVRSAAVRSAAVRSAAVRSAAVRSAAVRSAAVRSAAVRSAACRWVNWVMRLAVTQKTEPVRVRLPARCVRPSARPDSR
jgi:hypothetical protein